MTDNTIGLVLVATVPTVTALIGILLNRASHQDLKAELSGVRGELSSVRGELKAEISSVRSELKAEITNVRLELKAEITAFRSEVHNDILVMQGVFREHGERIAKLEAL